MGEHDRIQIRLTDDALEAWVSIGAGPCVASSVLARAIDDTGIVHGLDSAERAVLERALDLEQALSREIRLARGDAPVAPVPERLVLEEPDGLVAGVLREDGSMDFRERRLLVPVEAGDLLARILPAKEGVPGTSVLGSAIPAPETDAPAFALGDGVVFGDDGEVRAARNGARALDDKGLLDVMDLHTHAGSVDLASGNLESEGHLAIARDVTTNMRVTAGGSVRVGGSVDGGRVEAGLDVEVVGGAIGRESGLIRARGDLRARHALGIRLYAMGRVAIARSVSASRVHGREVEVGGHALSERIDAEERIVVQQAGSPAGGPCHLRVGVPLHPEDFDPSRRPARIGTARRSGRGSRSARGGGARKRRNRGARRKRSVSAAGVLTDDDVNVRIEWRRKQKALVQRATIEIQRVAHAGCRLCFGDVQRVLDADAGPCTYRLDAETDEIVVDD